MLEYYTIAIIALLGAMSPGPDFAVVAQNALTHHRRAGILSALGISCGILVHTIYCVFGLALVIKHTPFLFNLIKYLGAAYLFYIGLRGILSKNNRKVTAHEPADTTAISDKRAWLDGFLVNLLNPKFTLFILSIFTVLINPNSPVWKLALYGIEISVVSIIWFSALACLLGHTSVRKYFTQWQYRFTQMMGLVLIGVAIFVVFA